MARMATQMATTATDPTAIITRRFHLPTPTAAHWLRSGDASLRVIDGLSINRCELGLAASADISLTPLGDIMIASRGVQPAAVFRGANYKADVLRRSREPVE